MAQRCFRFVVLELLQFDRFSLVRFSKKLPSWHFFSELNGPDVIISGGDTDRDQNLQSATAGLFYISDMLLFL